MEHGYTERLTRLNGTSDAVGSVSHTLLGLVKAGFLRVGCDGLPKFCSEWSAKALRGGLDKRTRGQEGPTVSERFAAGVRHVD